MNIVEQFISDNANHLGIDPTARFETMFVTPRFKASAHVVALVFESGSRVPRFAAKMPRRQDADSALFAEALYLRSLTLPEVPRVLACERWGGTTILLETGLPQPSLDAKAVRRKPERCADAGTSFLIALARETSHNAPVGNVIRRAQRACKLLGEYLPNDAALFEDALRRADAIDRARVTSVMEHGDVSAPNLLFDGTSLGLVDWETAVPDGLPALDLFFFLYFLSSSRERHDSVTTACAKAFGRDGWARKHVFRYATESAIERELLNNMFALVWLFQAASQAERVAGEDGAEEFVREHRYVELLRYVSTRPHVFDFAS